MNLYFLDYDLRKEKDYQSLYDELEKFNAKRILESCWCFKSEATAVQLREHFKNFIDSNDGLIISQVSKWASYNVEKTPNDL